MKKLLILLIICFSCKKQPCDSLYYENIQLRKNLNEIQITLNYIYIHDKNKSKENEKLREYIKYLKHEKH